MNVKEVFSSLRKSRDSHHKKNENSKRQWIALVQDKNDIDYQLNAEASVLINHN